MNKVYMEMDTQTAAPWKKRQEHTKGKLLLLENPILGTLGIQLPYPKRYTKKPKAWRGTHP